MNGSSFASDYTALPTGRTVIATIPSLDTTIHDQVRGDDVHA
jgi:hypothetical protein